MEHFILRRRGSFVSRSSSVSMDWCKDSRHSDFDYEITLICKDSGQKVVIYHEDIAAQITSPSGTCEQMTAQICMTIKRLLEERNLDYNLIHIKLMPRMTGGGTPPANMEYVSYKRIDDVKLIALV